MKILGFTAAVAVLSVVIFVVMTTGIYACWHYSHLDSLLGLDRPVSLANVAGLLGAYQVFGIPATIKGIADLKTS